MGKSNKVGWSSFVVGGSGCIGLVEVFFFEFEATVVKGGQVGQFYLLLGGVGRWWTVWLRSGCYCCGQVFLDLVGYLG